MELRIDHQWDGTPLQPSDGAIVRTIPTSDTVIVEVDAPFWGDAPPSSELGSCWALWEHEVVELFILGPQGHYLEIELGPHGHYLVLELRGKRNIVRRELPLRSFHVERAHGRWQGRAVLDRALLPPPPHAVQAAAVHGVQPRVYAAYRPSRGDKPDFHRLDVFEPCGAL